MARKRFTEKQIIGVLKQADRGVKTADLCRQHGITETTFYRWKAAWTSAKLGGWHSRRIGIGGCIRFRTKASP